MPDTNVNTPEKKKLFNFSAENWKKVLIGAAITGGAAAITYTVDHIMELELGVMSGFVVAGLVFAVDYLKNLLKPAPTPVPGPTPTPTPVPNPTPTPGPNVITK